MQRSASNGEHAAVSGVRAPAARGVTGNEGPFEQAVVLVRRRSEATKERETTRRMASS